MIPPSGTADGPPPAATGGRGHGHGRLVRQRTQPRADVDEGRGEVLTSDEPRELVALGRDSRRLETENEIPRRAAALLAGDGTGPKMIFPVVAEPCGDRLAEPGPRLPALKSAQQIIDSGRPDGHASRSGQARRSAVLRTANER